MEEVRRQRKRRRRKKSKGEEVKEVEGEGGGYGRGKGSREKVEKEEEKEKLPTSATVLLTRSIKFSKSTRLKSGCCFSLYSSWAKASSWCLRMDPVEEEQATVGVTREPKRFAAKWPGVSGGNKWSRRH